MELPNVGHQCSQLDCKQLDFLPLQCKCGKQFCSEHFNKHIQTCEVYSRIETEPKKIENIYKCTRDGCNETSLVPLICNKCQQHFCVKHRHITQCHDTDEETIAKEKEKYAAPLRQFNEAKGAVDKQIENSIKEAKLKGKNASLANKLQLMKIKNKATGLKTIPLGERVYFNIFQANSRVTPVFVSKKWSVGRAIDAIADECKLQNDNNKSKGRKLRLFKKDTGVLISNNVADILEFLINGGAIIDGENLLINYINDA